jgi:formate/nitrite transporter FocA (FNT family)
MSMKMLELSKSMEQKQNTMKNIMSFWLVLTIINLIGSICIAMKISDFFKYLQY